MALFTCPTCKATFEPAGLKTLPFCSLRCRQIDLGRWLDEKQALPYVRDPDEEEEAQGQGDSPAD